MPNRKEFTIEKNELTLKDYIQRFNELSSVFNTMPIGVFAILDQKSNIATINKTASEILDSDSQAFIGKNAYDVFEDRFPGIQKLIDETINNHRPIKNFTLEIEDSNAEVKTYLVSTAITNELVPIDFGVVLVLHDISEVTRLRRAAISMKSFGPLIGGSPVMKQVYSMIETVAQYNTTVLIYGETGTGKELVAR
ncbi:MAG: sigma 54-interacting transcriptional regulator, partial [bacterium]